MGRLFLEQMSGAKLFNCRQCKTNVTSIHELLSLNFTGSTGPAFLFNKVINVRFGRVERRLFLSGNHYVRDVRCKKCNRKLGWFYEMTETDAEQYKEGKTVLESAFIEEVHGFDWDLIIYEEETEF